MIAILNFIKYIIYAIDFLLVTIVFFLLSFLPTPLTKKFFPAMYQIWSLRFFRIFSIKEHIHEKFSKPLPKQFILISNHPSGIELMWLPSRFRVVPLAKYEIQDWFIIGRIIKGIGTIFVKRRDRASRHSANDALLQAAKDGKNIMIFPEGGCYGKRIQSFYKGAFQLSKTTGIPIIPTFLHYEEENTYYWGDYGLIKFMVRALFLPKNRNGHLYIFDAIQPENFKDEIDMCEHTYQFYLEAEKKYAL